MNGEKGIFDNTDVIYAYTRKQAIDDGVLVDVTETAKEAGFKLHTVVTRAVWDKIITPSDEARTNLGQSENGRLWDALWLLFVAVKRGGRNTDTIHYRMIVAEADASKGLRQEEVELKATIGPGDQGEPVLTILLPQED